ncbi:MMPL family protein [Anatilimnocola aggregata]|uniref:MMPL family protein n=1 Tax=Anatilimnocola aggregata TaxID=2528021 RepID=A0A517Y7U2_9BACT|nr:MMPL family transporter [Anatilimnocola aggregata]QDU26309.1 MMPL family protein [Anatilimnocola aggregata]
MNAERNPPGETSLLSRPLELLTAWSLKAPAWVVAAAVGLTLVSLLVTCNGLEFKTSRLDLLNAKSAYNQRWLAYLDEFGDRDDAVVVVQSADPQLLRKVLDDVSEQLRMRGKLFQSVMDRQNLSLLRGKALHYLPDQELNQLQHHTEQARRLLPRDAKHADPGLMLAQLNDTLEKVRAASPEAQQQLQARYGEVANALMLSLNPEQMQQKPPDWSQLNDKFDSKYLLSEHGHMGFVLCKLKIDESELARGSQAIAALRQMLVDTRSRYPEAWIGLTGMPIIEFDEMQSSQADMLWTGILSMVFVSILFIAGYGGLRHALMACVVLQLGMAWSFGFVTLAIGHLNILSSAFGVVVIGQGIDFSIHYVASYLKLRRLGHNTATALIYTARDVGPGVFTGAISTAAAFFAAGLTEFTGIAELGIIGGAGILLCVLATAIVLPSLIYLVDHSRENLPLPIILPAASWVRPLTRHPSLTIASTLAITLVLTAGVAWVRYDHNLLNLQPAHLESSEIERELFSQLDDSVWFAVSMCDSKEELAQRKAAFEKLPQVAKTEEIGSLLPRSTARKQQQIAQIHDLLVDLPQRPLPVTIQAGRLKHEVVRARQLLERDTPYDTPLQRQFEALAQQMNYQSDEQLAARLTMTSAALATNALAPLRALREFSDPSPPVLNDLPTELTDRYIGKSQRYLIKVYARGNIWDLDRLSKFVEQVESVDPHVTGHPVQTFYASQHMQQSYIYSGCYALIAVFVLLMLDFRNLWHSLLAMTPLGLGFVQMCGLIGWFNIPFNPANMIGLPLIIGIGLDEGSHLVHEMRRQRGRFKLEDSTVIAVILTSVTTMAGFGTLILSRHQGLRSMGQLLTLGVGLCLACTVLFLPSLLTILTRDRKPEHEEDEEEAIAQSLPTEELHAVPMQVASQSVVVPVFAEPAAAEPTYEDHVVDEEDEFAPDEYESTATNTFAPIELPVAESPALEPASPEPQVSYYRFELPVAPVPRRHDDILTLEMLRERLLNPQQPADVVDQAATPLPPTSSETTRIDPPTAEFSPLVFGPVTTLVPRRRALPRRVEPVENGPVESQSDQVN